MDEGRDEKGRFVEGNQEGFNSTEVAREMQLKAAKRRVENNLAKKRGAELVQALLERQVNDPEVLGVMMKAGYTKEEITNELACHVRQIEKAQRKGDTKAYSAVMKAAGYDNTKIDLNTKGGIIILPKEEVDGLNQLAQQ